MIIDFQNIQIKHEKSKQDAFESLCCQIFYYLGIENGWNNNAEYINKNGHGGDAGVEAYWHFNNSEEYGIQAKFTDNLSDLWSQINESVNTALAKHSNLKKYYICTPFDRTDMKQVNKKDGMKIWNEYVKKWKKIKDIDFIWFGKSELENQLIKDQACYKGMIKYWFDKNIFSKNWFDKHFEDIKIKANNRYSVDLNIETSTKDTILQIVKTKSLLNDYKEAYVELSKITDRLISYNCFAKLPNKETVILSLKKVLSIIHNNLYGKEIINISNIDNLFDEIFKTIHKITNDKKYIPSLPKNWGKNQYPKPTKDQRKQDWILDIRQWVRELNNHLYKIKNFILLVNHKNYLLFSNAGNGKTHLFCDLVYNARKYNEFIAILCFGHFLYKKTLQESIITQFDNFNNIDELLSSLDCYAKFKKQIALFLIDGINEWEYCDRKKIFSEIELLKNKVNIYSNIRLIISCREEYRKDIFTDNISNDYFFLRHYGFLDNSIDALYKFCEYYKIEPPATPLLTPELSNPLILKTLCESFQRIGKFPTGISGVSNIFQAYLSYLNSEISQKLDLDPDDNKVCDIIDRISLLLYENNGDIHIDKKQIKVAIQDLDNNTVWSKTILYNLEKEGLIVINKDYTYISYDRYRDFLTAKALVTDINEAKLSDTKKILREKIDIFCKSSYACHGLIDFLSIAVPEKWGFELIELYANEQLYEWFLDLLLSSFYHSVVQRDISSISEKTLIAFENLKNDCNEKENYYWQTIISAALIENHPLNANYLHEKLKDLSMSDIDADWTQFISQNYVNYYDREYSNANNFFSIKHIIMPFLKLNNITLNDNAIELITTLLIWFTTSTNKELRDLATITSVNLLRNREDVAIKLLNKFKGVKDIYLLERLYSIIYGVVLFSNNSSMVDKIADIVYENIFNAKLVCPNILIRIDSYGIIDASRILGNNITKYGNKFKPPYNYPKIIDYPSFDALKNKYEVRPKKNEPVELYSTNSILHSTCAGSGDFARYIVGDSLDYDWDNPPNNKEYCAWICEKAYDFGWSYEKHGKFDYYINLGNGRQPAKIERIGKKYQWIAYHEYLCNLLDNYKKKDGWGEKAKTFVPKLYNLLNSRRSNIDPSLIPNRPLNINNYVYSTPSSWTQPNISTEELFSPMELKKQLEWLDETQDIICKGKGLIEVTGFDSRKKIILNNFITKREDLDDNELTDYYRDFGTYLRSFICKSKDKTKIINKMRELSEQKINGFNIYHDSNEVAGSCYLNYMEYPDSEFKESLNDEIYLFDNKENIENYESVYACKRDSALYENIPLYSPHKKLIKNLRLKLRKDKSYIWENVESNPILYNSIFDGADVDYNVPYVDKENFINSINKTDLSIIFSVSTEKRLLYKDAFASDIEYYHWMYYFTLYEFDKKGNLTEIYHNSFRDRE